MREKADRDGVDLLLIDTGDRVEGNGLYDASTPKGAFTYDIFREQPIDVVSTGNHELYQADTADREHKYMVPNMGDHYLASNLDYIRPDTGERVPMARRWRRITTPNQGVDIAAFGFIFDFTGNANNTVVQPVEDTVRERWFREAIRTKPDLFVVIGHVGIRMPEFGIIHCAIRAVDPDTPIAFFGGHAHVRDAVSFDERAFALASGRYMETIGWMSIDGISHRTTTTATAGKETPKVTFHRRYIDNNLYGLHHHSGRNATTFPTEHGRRVSAMIGRARVILALDRRYGCAPRDLWMTRAPYPSRDSIYSWLEEQVLPDMVVKAERSDVPRLIVVNTGGIRFDIFKGPFTKDALYIVSPFISRFVYIPDVPYEVATRIIALINSGGEVFEAQGLQINLLAVPEQMHYKESVIYETTSPAMTVQDSQKPVKPTLTRGYTTRDDFGTDGDDTIHEPISFYAVPNCIAAEVAFDSATAKPKTVDLVFIDFLQPWIILASGFAGRQYSAKDVLHYRSETLTNLMAEWIQKNWKQDC